MSHDQTAELGPVTGPLLPVPRHTLVSEPSGTFRYDLTRDRWWWSPQLYRLFGHEPEAMAPTTGTLLAHVVPGDRERVEHLLRLACHIGHPFVDQHLVTPADGGLRTVVAAAGADLADDGSVASLFGFVVDVTASDSARYRATVVQELQQQVEQLRQALRSRDLIGQAKGMIQLTATCDEDTAWAVLVRVSQTTNRKVADLAAELVAGLTNRQALSDELRQSVQAAMTQYR